MNYKELITKLKENNLLISYDDVSASIDYVSYNSKDVKKNTLFVCKGVEFKKEYLEEAILKGASVYISEKKYDVSAFGIIVSNVRSALSIISSMFYTDDLFKIGITGTKGKTTVNYFIHNILKHHLGYEPGIIATHKYYDGNGWGENELTTPESLELHKYFHNMTLNNLKYVSMEVSSQAVFHSRVFGMHFDIGAFLNISEDHISPLEHKNFEKYFNCKVGFLKLCDKIVLFKHTDYYEEVLENISDKEVITYGYNDADYIIRNVEFNDNISFEVFDGKNTELYEINMLGRFNVVNATCAIVIAKLLGVSYENICKGLLETSVSGRMNLISGGVCPIIIDYAHNKLSAEALYKSLKADFPDKKIKVLFGCPGNKGFNRRKEMGTLAGEYASYVYLTAEDPGNSTVKEICEDISKYIEKYHHNYEIIEDRKEAISKAISDATSDDVLVLMGKGDENYQIIGNEFVPYETDMVIVSRELSKVKE